MYRRLRLILTLLPALALSLSLAAPAAFAAPSAGEAEHQRLVEDTQRLASRNAWRGVEGAYRQMEALEAKGVVLTYADHLLGAQAARDAGDIALVKARLLRAAGLQKTDEVKVWLADIDGNFGAVELSVAEGTRATLGVSEMPLAPDQRAAIDLARGKVASERAFTGLLPAGTYSLGEQPFTVVVGASSQKVALGPPTGPVTPPPPSTEPHTGLRLALGGLAGRAGESKGEGPQPNPFGGGGLRLGAGIDMGLSRSVGLFGEAAYLGVFGGVDNEVNNKGEVPDRLQLAQLWGGAALWRGPIRFSVGPTLSFGRASASGGSVPCEAGGGLSCDSAALETSSFEPAKLVLGGGAAGLHVALKQLGNSPLHVGLSLDGGLQSDTDRAYPWGALSLGLSPG